MIQGKITSALPLILATLVLAFMIVLPISGAHAGGSAGGGYGIISGGSLGSQATGPALASKELAETNPVAAAKLEAYSGAFAIISVNVYKATTGKVDYIIGFGYTELAKSLGAYPDTSNYSDGAKAILAATPTVVKAIVLPHVAE